MKSPITGKEMTIQKEWRKMSFRKEEFDVCFHTWMCEDTGEQFEDEHFAQLNYNQLQNQYRAKFAIPFPDEIKAVREKYGLSASKMSEVLGFGANGYRQYESGEIPSHSNARLIQLCSDPHEFMRLIEYSQVVEGTAYEKLKHKIEIALQERRALKQTAWLEHYLFEYKQLNSLTGFRKPNLSKIAEMVLYFSNAVQPMKTKLNKLMFYADFLHFSQTAFSISGASYKAIPMGPVPINYESIYEHISNNDVVEIQSIQLNNDMIGEKFVSKGDRAFDSTLFTKSELTVLETIANKFKNISTRDIIDISHQETAWINNQAAKNVIDYVFAFELTEV